MHATRAPMPPTSRGAIRAKRAVGGAGGGGSAGAPCPRRGGSADPGAESNQRWPPIGRPSQDELAAARPKGERGRTYASSSAPKEAAMSSTISASVLSMRSEEHPSELQAQMHTT